MDVDPRNPSQSGHNTDLTHLLRALDRATGPDKEVDATLAECLGLEHGDYTSDAVLSRELVTRMRPRSRLQVGYDVNGILPSATLQEESELFSAIAPTVPLAILRVLVAALLERQS